MQPAGLHLTAVRTPACPRIAPRLGPAEPRPGGPTRTVALIEQAGFTPDAELWLGPEEALGPSA